jgi:hypothetical protein
MYLTLKHNNWKTRSSFHPLTKVNWKTYLYIVLIFYFNGSIIKIVFPVTFLKF